MVINKNISKYRFINTVFGSNWNLFEYLLLGINVLVTLALLIYKCVTVSVEDWTIWVAFFANITNIISVIMATKKKIFCFVWGLMAVILLGAISYATYNTGNWILYWVIYIPSQITAFFIWRKHSNDKINVIPRHMVWWGFIVLAIVILGMTSLFTWIDTLTSFQKFWYHKTLDDRHLYENILDASILIISLAMTALAILRFSERWILSILVDACSIALWASMHEWIIMVSCISMFIAAIYGLIKWRK